VHAGMVHRTAQVGELPRRFVEYRAGRDTSVGVLEGVSVQPFEPGTTLSQLLHDDGSVSPTRQRGVQPDPSLARRANDLDLIPPIDLQEVWAAGVTYLRSKTAREQESANAGGASFYDKVYTAPRPELFLKATASRVEQLRQIG